MDKPRGRLYLIPTPVIDNGLHTLSAEVIRVIHSLDYFIVERARTSRRLVSSTQPPVPVDQMIFEEIDNELVNMEQVPFLLSLVKLILVHL